MLTGNPGISMYKRKCVLYLATYADFCPHTKNSFAASQLDHLKLANKNVPK